MSDMVNHPPHYTSGPPCQNCGQPVECITVTREMNFNIGNVIKYLWRAGKKSDVGLQRDQKLLQDLKKAAWYLADEIKRLEGEK